MVAVLLIVHAGVHIQVTALVEAYRQAAFAALVAAKHEARHTQVDVRQVHALVIEYIVVVDAGVADSYVVELHRPVAGRGVLLSRAVAGEVLQQAGEVETLTLLLHIGMQASQGDMSKMQCLEGYLQQAHTDVQRVEAHKDILAIVLVHGKVAHTHVTAKEVHPHMLHSHLAARQLLAVAVDVALRYRTCQQRHNKQQGQHYADHPKQYLPTFFHIPLYYLSLS